MMNARTMMNAKTIKRTTLFISILLFCMMAFSILSFGANGDFPLVMDVSGLLSFGANDFPLVMDVSGLLTDEEDETLLDHLQTISDKYDFDVVVVTVPSLGGRPAHEFAADWFEAYGFGRGNHDGCILLLATDDRDFGFAALGYGNKAFTEYGQDYLGDFYVPYLKQDMYYEAFMSYGDGADEFLKMAKAGTPYDKGNIPGEEEPEPTSKRGLFGAISVAISALIAKITTGSWKSQLKSVRSERGARKYVRQGSLNLTEQKDVFLYRNHNKMVIPKKTESTQGESFTTSKGTKATGHSGKY